MAKQSGLGDRFLVGGYDVSGDINAVDKISGGPAVLDSTDITQSAHSRLAGHRDGGIDFTAFMDAATAHVILSTLPTTDTLVTYLRGTTLGNAAASEMAKQVGYDPNRGADGSLTLKVSAPCNGFGVEWGTQLTAGLRTDTAATNGTSVDDAAATSFGVQAYLQVTAFTGTDATVKIQDSADNVTFADVSGLAFTQVTAAHKFQRLATSNTATLRRYVRAVTVTTGGFTSVTFSVVYIRNATAGQVF